MNYEQAIDWLYGFQKHGIKLGLERIKFICKKLGDPQKDYKTVHVGGTNGKGSVCRFLGSILTKNGYKTGVYTSPHLQRFSERFIIDDKEISKSDIIKLVNKIKPIVDEIIKNGDTPTYFEIVTALAFQYFSDKKVEYAIIEVGLGGRFDATNIVSPIVSVITNISIEHQDRLGDKIEDIAFEKAGIIKKKIPVVTGASGKALEIIKQKIMENNNSAIFVDKDFYEKVSSGVDQQEYLIHGILKDYSLKLQMPGVFQGENLAIAIATIEALQMNGVYVADESIADGVYETTNPGRMEILGFEPVILLDGSHNVAGINALKETLEKDFVYENLILVIGILSDKNIKGMLEIIVPIADYVVVTKPNNSRACNPLKIREMISGPNIIIKNSVSEAVNHAKKIAKKQDLILVTGSLFTVGEARDILK